jgi:P-type conjugative transfer protein TrbJ
VNPTLAQVDVLMRQGQAISYSVANLDAVFEQTFPGGRLSPTMAADMQLQNERTLATIHGALAAARASAQQVVLEATRLGAIKQQLRAITSAQQAAELTGVIGIHTAEELTLLRQQLAAQGNAEAVVSANQVNHEAQATAAATAFREAGAAPMAPHARRDARAMIFEP